MPSTRFYNQCLDPLLIVKSNLLTDSWAVLNVDVSPDDFAA